MICEGSSTKSHATLVPARLRTSTRPSRWCEQVAELVEERLHLAVREQRGLAADGRAQVAADQAEVRSVPAARHAGDEVVHPGAAALLLAREQVGVERAERGRRRRASR